MRLLKDRLKTIWEDDFTGSPQELMKMRLNKFHLYMVIILLVTGVLYTAINILYGLRGEAWVTSTAIVYALFALLMYAWKWYLFSKILLVLYVTAAVTMLAMISGIENGVLIFMAPVIVGCLIVLQGDERKYAWTLIALVMACSIWIMAFEPKFFIQHEYTPEELWSQRLLNFIGAFLAIGFQVGYLNRVNGQLMSYVTRSRKELEVINKDIQGSFSIIAEKNIVITRQLEDLRKVENQLSKLSFIATRIRSGVIIADTSGRIEWVNKAFERMTGWTLEEVIGKKPREFLQREGYSDKEIRYLSDKLKNLEYARATIINFTKNGDPYHNDIEVTPIFDEQGRHVNFISLQRDVTAELTYIREIEALKARYELVVNEVTHDYIWEWDLNSEKIVSNIPIPGIFEKKRIGDKEHYVWTLESVHPEDRPVLLERRKASLDRKASFCGLEYRYRDLNGLYRIFTDRSHISYDAQGQPVQMIGAISDITDQRKLEKDLVEEKIKQQRLIAQVALQSQERDNNVVAEELHENINQVLSVSKMYLDFYNSKMEHPDQLLVKSMENIEKALTDIRKLSHALATPLMAKYDLMDAIKDLVNYYGAESNPIKINLIDAIDRNARIPQDVKISLYRIVQEQLENVFRHSKATEATIEIRTGDNAVQFMIRDNGIGFDQSLIREESLGFKKIQSRVMTMGGELTLSTSIGNGCLLIGSLPMDKAPALVS